MGELLVSDVLARKYPTAAFSTWPFQVACLPFMVFRECSNETKLTPAEWLQYLIHPGSCLPDVCSMVLCLSHRPKWVLEHPWMATQKSSSSFIAGRTRQYDGLGSDNDSHLEITLESIVVTRPWSPSHSVSKFELVTSLCPNSRSGRSARFYQARML